MGKIQRFQIRETIPNLPGERVCAGPSCHAAEYEDPDPGDSPVGGTIMEHTDTCEEVRRLAAGG